MSDLIPRLSLADLPNELLVKVIEHIPYDSSTFGGLGRINRCFRGLMANYTHSITLQIAYHQYPALCRIYPSPPAALATLRLQWLAMLDQRSRTVARILDLIANGPLEQLVPRESQKPWVHLLSGGLHHLYRIHDCTSYEEKVAYITSLTLLPLALLYISLVFSLRTAQQIGTGILHSEHGPVDEEQRMELCLCFEECTLWHGPDFIHKFLAPSYSSHCHQCDSKTNDAHSILENEYDAFDTREFGVDGRLPRRTLISYLKRAIADRGDCALEKVYQIVWNTVQSKEVLRRSWSVEELEFA